MGRNNLNSFESKVMELNNFLVTGQRNNNPMGDLAALQSMAKQFGEGMRDKKKSQWKNAYKATEQSQEQDESTKHHPKKNKKQKHQPVAKDRDSQLEEQIKRKQQEVHREETRLREEENSSNEYWRDAILLSEIIGDPIAKRRRMERRRMGRM
ncbi:hypothetical protein [Niameybacter massiliensis]|uniref:hypothetical protein n=1 Tax=Niameybacter massiliensis TaxID=1658108 RepID=UPI0006B4E920|nr:hypothetical protein [Niameybacter massiliensis]